MVPVPADVPAESWTAFDQAFVSIGQACLSWGQRRSKRVSYRLRLCRAARGHRRHKRVWRLTSRHRPTHWRRCLLRGKHLQQLLITRHADRPTRFSPVDQNNERRHLSHLKTGRYVRLALDVNFLNSVASRRQLIDHRPHLLARPTTGRAKVQEHRLGRAGQRESNERQTEKCAYKLRFDHRFLPWIPRRQGRQVPSAGRQYSIHFVNLTRATQGQGSSAASGSRGFRVSARGYHNRKGSVCRYRANRYNDGPSLLAVQAFFEPKHQADDRPPYSCHFCSALRQRRHSPWLYGRGNPDRYLGAISKTVWCPMHLRLRRRHPRHGHHDSCPPRRP